MGFTVNLLVVSKGIIHYLSFLAKVIFGAVLLLIIFSIWDWVWDRA
jgi:hypothetical protein